MQSNPRPLLSKDNINGAVKSPKRTFTASKKYTVAATPASPAFRSIVSTTPSTISTRSLTGSLPTPVTLTLKPATDTGDNHCCDNSLHYDNESVPVLPHNHGVRWLWIAEVLRLMDSNQCTLVVPPSDYKQPKDTRVPSNVVRDGIRRMIRATAWSDYSASEKDAFVGAVFGGDGILREGKQYHELNVRVMTYAERHILDAVDPLSNDISHMLGNGNAGLNLEIKGIGPSKPYLLRLSHLPYVKVFVQRESDGAFLDPSVSFSAVIAQKTFVSNVQKELFAANGDPTKTVQIMMHYHKTLLSRTARAATNVSNTASRGTPTDWPAVFSIDDDVRKKVSRELNEIDLSDFANTIDKEYENAMTEKFSDFSHVPSFLITDAQISQHYNNLKRSFPTCHFVFATIVSSSTFTVEACSRFDPDDVETTAESIHQRSE